MIPLANKPYSLPEILSYSSLIAAITGVTLVAATSASIGASISLVSVGIVFFGTLGVYNLDRIRDLPRDISHAPRRSKFITLHKKKLTVLCVASGLLAFSLVMIIEFSEMWGLLPVVILGVFHRRLKVWPIGKSAYVAIGWTVTLVVLANANSGAFDNWGNTSLVLFFSLFANTSMSGAFANQGSAKPAIVSAFLAIAIALFTEPPVRCLFPLAAFAGLGALLARRTELYRSIVLDCMLALGATLSWFNA